MSLALWNPSMKIEAPGFINLFGKKSIIRSRKKSGVFNLGIRAENSISLKESDICPGEGFLKKRIGRLSESDSIDFHEEELPLTHPPSRNASAPAGTPVVPSLRLARRPRRNRKCYTLRASFQETSLSPANLVYPLFIHEGVEDVPIEAMPDCYRHGWRHGLLKEVIKAKDVGVNSVILFPKIADRLKSPTGDEAYNPDGLIPRAIRLLKDTFPDIVVYTDVALDPYSSDGHDGIIRADGVVLNDETVHQLCKQALSQARAGADVVSPSDMMDGRIGAIRAALDSQGFQHVSIMSYVAKYESAFYGPFRDALQSSPRFGDKKSYQMNPANSREALVEAREDEAEGADILLVKPGLPYLDIISLLRHVSPLPIAAYQVSGEYSMIKAGGAGKMIDEEKIMMESLLCLRRAGADVILTYFAARAAAVLSGERKLL